MSNAIGKIYSSDRTQILAYFEYYGTSDQCNPVLRKTREEVEANWRQGEWKYCSDPKGHAQREVIIYSDYGYGWHWNGTICETCGVISSPLSCYDGDEWGVQTKGEPELVQP